MSVFPFATKSIGTACLVVAIGICGPGLNLIVTHAACGQDATGVQSQRHDEFDWPRFRQLQQKRQRGELLTPEEAAIFRRAQQLMHEQALRLDPNGEREPRSSIGLIPLTEMSAEDRYLGEDGGLYGAGMNEPPDALREAALNELTQIVPRDAIGRPDPRGSIGFVSISMSNATQEFSYFKRVADADPVKSPRVKIVDCAQGGQAMAEWVDPQGRAWREADRRLRAAKISPLQVQVAWIKLANKNPIGELTEHGKRMQSDTMAVLHNARQRFPNLRIAYLSSRTYGGYSVGTLNPEPFAYEGAFVVRWLIQAQLEGNDALNCDPERGVVRAPLLVWGPYLWADGETPRKSDGLTWLEEDFSDAVHPTESGRRKVCNLMMDYFKNNPLAAPWFTGRR
ncbi:MAG TPA: hypothetical protein PKD54_02515 [Pirellulaceae bacterium]|nr:hypothetical protein [Pirellulaceae bacterium]